MIIRLKEKKEVFFSSFLHFFHLFFYLHNYFKLYVCPSFWPVCPIYSIWFSIAFKNFESVLRVFLLLNYFNGQWSVKTSLRNFFTYLQAVILAGDFSWDVDSKKVQTKRRKNCEQLGKREKITSNPEVNVSLSLINTVKYNITATW